MPWHEGWQLIVDEFQLWILVPLPPFDGQRLSRLGHCSHALVPDVAVVGAGSPAKGSGTGAWPV